MHCLRPASDYVKDRLGNVQYPTRHTATTLGMLLRELIALVFEQGSDGNQLVRQERAHTFDWRGLGLIGLTGNDARLNERIDQRVG
jgi:hypothetical protein